MEFRGLASREPSTGSRALPRRTRRGKPSLLHAIAIILVRILAPRPAVSAPLDEPFVGGLGFNGPTSGNIASIYWNPAALGLVRGFQLTIGGQVRYTSTHVSRTPVDPMTGAAQPAESASASNVMQPASWPVGPGAFIGLSSDLGGDRFALGFATYMPYVQQIRYPLSPNGDEPTRYHALTIDLRNLALVPALSIRIGNELRIGVAPGFLFSTGHLTFDEDTNLDNKTPTTLCNGSPCFEDPAAAARYDISSGNGLGDAKFSVTLGGGIYFRRRSLEVGIAYQSHPLGTDVPGVEVAAQHTTVTLPPSSPGAGGMTGVPLSCTGPQSARCVFGDLSYRLPDVLMGGATWHVGTGLELTAMVRWSWFHVHDRIDVRLLGPSLEAANLPQHIVLYRGFNDVVDGRVRVSYWWHERVRVGTTLRVETSAIDANAVNPAAVDALKIEPLAQAEVRIGRRLWIAGGWGITFMPSVTVTDSAFNPKLATDCVSSNGDLAPGGPCQARLAGRARPSANGHYSSMTQDFGLTVTVRY